MDIKIKNRLFFVICFVLIFNNIPNILQMNLIGSILADKLVFYPLFIGCIYTIYCQYKYKNVLINFNKVKKYVFSYLIIVMLSLIVGLYNYPYYNMILNGPVEQIEKLPAVLAILQNLGLNVEEKSLLIFWMIARVIKGLLLETVYTIGGAYMIYCWYYNDWQRGFKILGKAIIFSLIIIFLYSSVEIFYLSGNITATEILIAITPFFHMIVTDHNWWPPLLWNGQLRSIFAEPSYFGMYASFAIPFLWYKFIKNTKYKMIYGLIILLFTFLLFLTKARTAVALFGGELIILLAYMIYLKNKIFFKNILLICIFTAISFVGANIFISSVMDTNSEAKINVEEYVEENLVSIASTEKRSNTARYSIMLANLKIGLDHPFLGIGLNLNDAYIPEYLPSMSDNSSEVNMWINDQKEKGILKSGFPSLGEYISRFAETGVLGLIAFLVPPVFLLINLLNKIRKENDLRYAIFMISFIGMLSTGIGDSINITYCYWILLGLGYVMCFGKSGDDIKHE